MWQVSVITPPTSEPLDLASEVVPFLRLNSDEAAAQGPLLAGAIAGARAACEAFTGRALVNRDVELWMTGWEEPSIFRGPDFGWTAWGGGVLRLPLAPVSVISSVKFLDFALTVQTWDPATGWDKILPAGEMASRAEIFPRYAQIWPVNLRQPASIKIAYTAGYGADYKTVPGRLKQGMLLYIGEAYQNRELMSEGRIALNPVDAERCWWPYRAF